MSVDVDAEAGTDLETTLEVRREGVPHPFEAGLDAACHLGHRCRAHSINLPMRPSGTLSFGHRLISGNPGPTSYPLPVS